MKHDVLEAGGLSYEPCRYGMSRIFFRGPQRNLEQPYLAFLGGTETFGKFIDHPFPDLLETHLKRPCVNFGCVNGGVDAFVNDPTIMGWVARMRNMIGQIGPRVMLLWFSKDDMTDEPWQAREKPLAVDPLFITESMVDQLRDLVMDVVVARPSESALKEGTRGMVVPPMQTQAATDMLGVKAHEEAMETLTPRISEALAILGR